MTVENHDKCEIYKTKIVKLLEEIGSIELMANMIMEELYAQTPASQDPKNAISENPIVAYVLGLFLSHNNIDAGEPTPSQIIELELLLETYFVESNNLISIAGMKKYPSNDIFTTISRRWKLLDDVNPHAYIHQKEEYYRSVFSPLNQYFITKYNFTVDFAQKFSNDLIIKIRNHFKKRWESYIDFYIKNIHYLKSLDYLKFCNNNNITTDQLSDIFFRYFCFHNNKSVFLIKLSDNDFNYNSQENKMLENLLNNLSCTFNDQFNEFDDILSNNIIFFKPIIKLDTDTFFVAKPNLLQYHLDILLEQLLNNENNKSNIQIKFRDLKSKYVENMLFKVFSRIFPQNCIFRNIYYYIDKKPIEVDMLIKYDNKIFIIEAKSSHIPVHVKIDGKQKLEKRLQDIIYKEHNQCIRTRDYIKSNPNATFWSDRKKKNIAVIIDTIRSGYEFILIGVNLESLLSGISNFTLSRHTHDPNFDKSFLGITLYDLDVITDLLTEPSYFIHFIQYVLAIYNKDNLIINPDEIGLLSMYIKNNLSTFVSLKFDKPYQFIISPSKDLEIDKYYVYHHKKPRVEIPKNLEQLIITLQKSYKLGFTKLTSGILDLPPENKNKLSDKIDKISHQLTHIGTIRNFGSIICPIICPTCIKIEFQIRKKRDGFDITCREL